MAELLTWKKSGVYVSANGAKGGYRKYCIQIIGESLWTTFTIGAFGNSLGWSPTLEIAKKNCQTIERYYVALEASSKLTS